MSEWLRQQFELWIERREARRLCAGCEILKEQLFRANNEKTQLLNQLIELTNPAKPIDTPIEEFKPIKPKMVPWHIRKSMLEAESRAEAKILKDQAPKQEVNDLEAEVMKLADEKLKEADNG